MCPLQAFFAIYKPTYDSGFDIANMCMKNYLKLKYHCRLQTILKIARLQFLSHDTVLEEEFQS